MREHSGSAKHFKHLRLVIVQITLAVSFVLEFLQFIKNAVTTFFSFPLGLSRL
jgi:hypothetical protein